jgi:hypothetical protein
MQTRMNRADLQTAGTYLDKAPTERGARDTIRALARDVPGAFQFDPYLAKNLGTVETEERDAWDEQMRGYDEMVGRAQAGGKGRREQRAQIDREIAQTDRDDAANLREWKAAKAARKRKEKEEARDEAQEARDTEHDDAKNLREWKAAQKTAPVRRAKSQVTAAAQHMGYGTPTDTQAGEMAQQVIALTKQGVNTNDAILAAVTAKARQIQQLHARLMQQQAAAGQLMQSTDQTGQFSMMPGAF